MPDKNGNYSEEEKRVISESYSKINVYCDETDDPNVSSHHYLLS